MHLSTSPMPLLNSQPHHERLRDLPFRAIEPLPKIAVLIMLIAAFTCAFVQCPATRASPLIAELPNATASSDKTCGNGSFSTLDSYQIGSIPHTLQKLAKSQYGQAENLRVHGEFQRAEEISLRLLRIIQSQLGTDHPFTLLPLQQLRMIYANQHRENESVVVLAKMEAMQRALLGDESPDAAETFEEYTNVLDHLGRRNQAIALGKQRLARLEHCSPHGYLARAQLLLFLSIEFADTPLERVYLHRAAQDALNISYVDRDGILLLLQSIGDALLRLKEWDVAMNIYQHLIARRGVRSSPVDEVVIRCLEQLSEVEWQALKFKESKSAASLCLSLSKQVGCTPEALVYRLSRVLLPKMRTDGLVSSEPLAEQIRAINRYPTDHRCGFIACTFTEMGEHYLEVGNALKAEPCFKLSNQLLDRCRHSPSISPKDRALVRGYNQTGLDQCAKLQKTLVKPAQ